MYIIYPLLELILANTSYTTMFFYSYHLFNHFSSVYSMIRWLTTRKKSRSEVVIVQQTTEDEEVVVDIF